MRQARHPQAPVIAFAGWQKSIRHHDAAPTSRAQRATNLFVYFATFVFQE
jgi:hypothetical protein